MPWRISLEVQGDQFHPSRIPFSFTEHHDPGVMGHVGRYRGIPIPYGSASYDVPRSIPVKDRIKHLVLTLEPILPLLKEAGATDWHISIGRYYYAQCNEEYSLEELQLITRLECGFTYSAYNVTAEEELELKKRY